MNENGQIVAAGGTALPPLAERCRAATEPLSPAGPENASVGKGVALLVAAIAALFLPLPLIGVVRGGFGIVMFISIVAFIVLFLLSLKHLMLGALTAVNVAKIEALLRGVLVPGERMLAVTMAKKSGPGLWLTGFSRQAFLVFTTHRLFLLGIKGLGTIKKSLDNPQDRITAMTCDLGDRSKVNVGGMLMPPGLHLFAKRLNVTPEGHQQSTPWAAFIRFGKNGRVINAILQRL